VQTRAGCEKAVNENSQWFSRRNVVAPKLEMFTKRRLKWTKPLDLPQFENISN
jgi:hypothetical protein